MTIMETRDPPWFDPLAEFYGWWNTRLAERYWSLLESLFGKWECVDGRLAVAPTQPSEIPYGSVGLISLLRRPARAAGFVVYGSLNLSFHPERWLQPDVCVLNRVPAEHDKTWVPADHFTMPVEFISRSSRKADLVDKPALCAEAGIPYYLHVKIDSEKHTVTITQLKLLHGEYKPIASAVTGEQFTMTEPFPVSFDVNELLEP